MRSGWNQSGCRARFYPGASWFRRLISAGLAIVAVGSAIGCSTGMVRFGYIATELGVYAFRINATNGAGSLIVGSPFVAKNSPTTATAPSSVALHPSNHFVYVANQDTNTISQFTIDPLTGALTEVLPRTPLVTPSGAVGLSPAVLTIDSGGKFLFVANQITNDVWVFSIGASGALTFVSSAQLAAPPSGLTLAAAANFLYVPIQDFSAIYVFSVSSGTLTQVGAPIVLNGGVGQLGIDPQGHFLYVPNPTLNTVTVLLIQPDGTLLQGPGLFATGTTPVAVATSSTGAFVYVANFGSGNISQFQLDMSTGTLTPLTTATVTTGTRPASIVVDSTAKFFFVINQGSDSVSEYTFNANGTLTSTGNTLQVNISPRSFVITR